MKKILLFVLLSLFLFNFVVAEDYLPHKQGDNLSFSITSNFADNCTLSDINYPNGLSESFNSSSKLE